MSENLQPKTFQQLLDLAAKGLDHKVDRRSLMKLGAVSLGGGLYMAGGLKWGSKAFAASSYTAGEVTDGGVISGLVGFAGSFPPAMTKPVSGQPEVVDRKDRTWCSLYGAPSGLENVFVGLESIASGKPFPTRENIIDQKDAFILPRFDIFWFTPDGTKTGPIEIAVKNDDAFLHALKGKLDGRQLFNVATPNKGDLVKATLKKPGFYELQCGPHPWERGWRIVANNPYWTMTDKFGRFKLSNVPPGSYTLVVIGEGIKPQLGKGIKVEAGKNTKLEIPLGAKHLAFA